MINNIDLLSSLKVSTPDSNTKAVNFFSNAAEKNNIFRDNLKESVRNRSQYETKNDKIIDMGARESKVLRKELISKSKEKLGNFKKLETNYNEKFNPVEENADKQEDLKETTVEEILLKLDELAKLQQMGDKTQDKQIELLENIKEALNDLVLVQTDSTKGSQSQIIQAKLTELAALLEGMQENLKTCGSLTSGDAFENSFMELKAIIAEDPAKVEIASNKQADKNANELTMSDITAEDKSYKELSLQSTGGNDNMTAKGSMTNETLGEQKHDVKAEASNTDAKLVTKEAQPAAEQITDEIKSALDSKVEKVNVSGMENKKQDTEAETNKEASEGIYKATGTMQNEQANEEIIAIKPEQTVIDNKIEVMQNQNITPKVQIVNKADVINQIVKKAEIIFADAEPEMKMQLEPENLGKLTLSIAVEKGLITAKFVAESYEVKQIIESNFNELKDMLQEKGLEIQNLSVSVGHDGREYNNNAFQQWKEAVKQNGRRTMRGSYEGYLTDEGTARIVNPYNVHNGEFDHRA